MNMLETLIAHHTHTIPPHIQDVDDHNTATIPNSR
ncbi:hypothetical protein XF_0773 [Xylella fastidiosa 9a5c]|uniref:Uncharacterized protein n=1 Tax=Xylella fastidiosa (strain 9a5c) TaxID=160492 RepID=Q9PFA5_XYLFA|nr:hypothetical protein XF_0773 [Xylella fastidiosa 9a5c]